MSGHVELYGFDGTNFIPVKVDANGNLVLGSGGTTSVGGTVPVSIPGTPSVLQARGVATMGAAIPDNTAGTVKAANASRKELMVYNNGTQTCYLGTANNVTTDNGFPLLPTATFIDDRTTGAWFGITAAGTANLRTIEVA